ncbi:MAG: PAS domain-containing sensor histidine kinase, partial [Bacteroidia bacterium]
LTENNTNELYRLLVESVKDYAIFLLDKNGIITTWNEGARHIKQYTAAEIIGKHFSIFYPEEDILWGKPAYELKGALKEGRFEDEGWRVKKDGTQFWANVIITPVYNSRGEHIGFSKVTRDLTERRNAEQNLAESAEQFRILGESVPQMIWTSLPTGEAFYMNKRWVEFTGYTINELTGDQWHKVLHPDDLETAINAWSELVDRQKEINIEVRLRRKDGVFRWHLTRALPVYDKKNNLILWVGSHTDIDDQKSASVQINIANKQLEKTVKQLEFSLKALREEVNRREYIEEELIEKNRQLEISNNDLEQFAYVASHDLREPLRMIGSYTSLLLARYNLDDPDIKEFAGFIEEGVSRMQILINDLLAYSRVGRTDIAFEQVEVSKMLEEAKETLRAEIENSNAKIFAPKLPVIEGVPSLISNLFQNLIGNAIKFRKPELTPEIRIDFTSTEEEWKFSVQDNGLGIPREYQSRIFIIFQRLHTRDKYDGTGIGLAICKKIAEFHGGKIWVESEIGQGSTFYFTIAKQQRKPQAAELIAKQ